MEDKLPRRIAWFAPWTWKRRTQIVVGLVVAFVGYPLSYGPACILAVDGLLPPSVINVLYRPLFLAIAYIPFVGEAVHWYIGVVLRLTGRDRNFG